jgi:hypothetical protein
MEAFGVNKNIDDELFSVDPIPERDLSDVLWNAMQREGHLNMYYVTQQFRDRGTPAEINAALDTLLSRGRAVMTPGGRRMLCLWGWKWGRPGE